MPKVPSVQSPNIYNLGLYGIYPVDFSTGVPKIEIPIYTIKSGSLTFPITISYHASGIKVNQEASAVGLGWSLNAGGAIIRTLKDRPDELSTGFLSKGNSIPFYNEINDPLLSGAGIKGNNSVIKSFYNPIPDSEGSNVYHNDKYPDLFSILTNVGISGDFTLNNDLKFVSTEFEPHNLDVNLANSLIIVKDEKGNIYRFGKSIDNIQTNETVGSSFSQTEGLYSGSRKESIDSNYDSSWHLSEIISSDKKDTIKIEYKSYKSESYYTFLSESKTYLNTFRNTGRDDKTKSYLLSNSDNNRIISAIKFKDGRVEFAHKQDRQDITPNTNLPRISGVRVYDIKNTLIQTIDFDNNDYFDRPKISNINDWFQNSYKKSLKLNSIKFYNKNLIIDNSFKFQYDYDIPLPARESSYAIDYWGYYNGQNNNSTLLPEVLFEKDISENTLSNNNRQSDFLYMKSGILNKIIYPTGGYTLYEYEPNYFLTQKQQEQKVVADNTISVYAIKSVTNCTEENSFPVASPKTIKEFEITEDAFGVLDCNIFFSDHVSLGMPLTAKIEVDGVIRTASHGYTPAKDMKTESFTFPIHKGSKIKVELDTQNTMGPSKTSPCNSPFIFLKMNYNYYKPTTPEQIKPTQAGGLRVKRITNIDNNNSILSKKEYVYGSKQINGIGIGKILTDPFKFENHYSRFTRFVNSNYTAIDKMDIISSNPFVELSLSNGSPVFYDKVSEYTLDKENNSNTLGKTEYFYEEKGRDIINTSNILVPYPTYIYPSWKRSQPISTINYKYDNNYYLPIKKEKYTYSKLIENRIRTLNIFERDTEVYQFYEGGNATYNNPDRFYYFNDYVSIGKQALIKKEITDFTYAASKKDSLLTTTKYEYNNPAHFQLTKENTILPDLNKQETTYQYAHEKGNQYLIDKNMIGIPLQTSITQKQNDNDPGKTISKSEILYPTSQADANTRTSGLALPVSVLGFDLQNPEDAAKAQTEITYDLYDNKGNILQYSVKGKPVTVIWGYGQTQPIVKIEGAAYNQVSAYVSAIIAASDADNTQGTDQSEQALIGALDILRNNTALSAYQITTYTYNPLIGVTSITPPSGIREIYKYDSANRLESVKDVNGNLLKEYQYRYKN
ncbi:hypothetical protein M2T78_02710 [Elizabethkingia ursingii]|uniref:hypothetical protein n=1 Tax=Elizabethkingia ursingii TaxID=1756150 RepID=UPI0020115E23|nr:hypothetical protein [Elizabethkingia ursingii]MCL1663146.1 hypothetical protein [Elizabethkingia ursingii]